MSSKSVTEKELLEMLGNLNLLIENDHIELASGRHSSTYFDKDKLYRHARITSLVCREIAMEFLGCGVDVVVAPEKGGIVLCHGVALHLSELAQREALAFYAEKTGDGGFVFKRGGTKEIIRDKKVLIVDDVLTTGGSAKKMVELVRSLGGGIVGFGAVCNRGNVRAGDIGIMVGELFAFIDLKLDDWDKADCPLCKKGIPLNTQIGKMRQTVG